MKRRTEQLVENPSSKKILSNIIFSTCHAQVSGLTARKLVAMVEIDSRQHSAKQLNDSVIKSRVQALLLPKPTQTNDYEVYRTRVPLELTNGTEGSLGLMDVIMAMPDEEIRYKYRQLINFKWHLLWGVSFFYTLIYYVLNVLASVFFGYQQITIIGILIIVLNVFFIACDVKCVGSEWRHYLRDPMNWIDFIVHGYSLAASVITLTGILP